MPLQGPRDKDAIQRMRERAHPADAPHNSITFSSGLPVTTDALDSDAAAAQTSPCPYQPLVGGSYSPSGSSAEQRLLESLSLQEASQRARAAEEAEKAKGTKCRVSQSSHGPLHGAPPQPSPNGQPHLPAKHSSQRTQAPPPAMDMPCDWLQGLNGMRAGPCSFASTSNGWN